MIPLSRKHSSTKGAIPLGQLIVHMLDNDYQYFDCRDCGERTKLQFTKTFPFCADCFEIEPHSPYKRQACVVANCERKEINYGYGMLCTDCVTSLELWSLNTQLPDIDGLQHLNLAIHHMQNGVEIFRYDVPLLAKQAAEELLLTFNTTCSKRPSDILNLFIFADVYGISSLRNFACLELFRRLAWEEITPNAVADLVELVYGTTPDSGIGASFSEKHVLRRLVSAYAAYHGQALQTSPEMAGLLNREGEFGRDLFMAMSMLAGGKLDKGWRNGGRCRLH